MPWAGPGVPANAASAAAEIAAGAVASAAVVAAAANSGELLAAAAAAAGVDWQLGQGAAAGIRPGARKLWARVQTQTATAAGRVVRTVLCPGRHPTLGCLVGGCLKVDLQRNAG